MFTYKCGCDTTLCMTAFRRWFREYPVLGAGLVGVVAGLLVASWYYYFIIFRVRQAHPMLYFSGPSYLNILLVGVVVGLFLGIVGGYLYKYYARKP